MLRKTSARIAAAGILAAALVAGTATAAYAAEPEPTVGSKGPFFIGDAGNGSIFPADTELAFSYAVIGMVSDDPAQIEASFPGTADSTQPKVFISPRGSERTPSAWTAWADGGFTPGTNNVLYPTVTLDSLINGNLSTVRAGGNFSLGLAFTKNNGLAISADDVYYTHVTTMSNGKWKFAYPSEITPPPANEFDVNLEAQVLDVNVPEVLELTAPAVTTATIGDPTIVNGLSTSTGRLGDFTVTDTRYSTHPGWTLTTTVTDFTHSTDSSQVIAPQQLGVAPTIAAPNAQVTLSNPQVAGSATYPSVFAQSGNTAPSGTVTMNADLKFVAPADKIPGTYKSTLTLTLTSK